MATNEIPVSIDADFARIGAKSYAINKINSVEIKTRYPNSRTLPLIAAFGIVIALLSKSFTAAVLLAALAAWLWWRSRIVEYQLYLTTSSAEIAALKSADLDFITGLRNKIESAMARASAAT